MARFWPNGIAIRVIADQDGTPERFYWQGRMHMVHLVTRRWRVDEGWWHVRLWREYFKLATESGLLVIIYRDLMTRQWFLQRLYD